MQLSQHRVSTAHHTRSCIPSPFCLLLIPNHRQSLVFGAHHPHLLPPFVSTNDNDADGAAGGGGGDDDDDPKRRLVTSWATTPVTKQGYESTGYVTFAFKILVNLVRSERLRVYRRAHPDVKPKNQKEYSKSLAETTPGPQRDAFLREWKQFKVTRKGKRVVRYKYTRMDTLKDECPSFVSRTAHSKSANAHCRARALPFFYFAANREGRLQAARPAPARAA